MIHYAGFIIVFVFLINNYILHVGFSLRARLLEISNSLSAKEVKQIKFLAKSKVSGFRLARFTEALELFEELETSGEFSCDYIGKLLAGIQRYDLVEKLGIYVPGAEKGFLVFFFNFHFVKY